MELPVIDGERADLSYLNLSLEAVRHFLPQARETRKWWGPAYIDAMLTDRRRKAVKLERADLRGAILIDADLRGVNLRGAQLKEANLYGANLQNADLSGADLEGAALIYADLRDAKLYGTNLEHAHLLAARLEHVDLTQAHVTALDIDGNTSLDRTKLRREQLGPALGSELEGKYDWRVSQA